MAGMSDLSGARAKVERAKEHINDLSTQKALFLSGDPYGVTAEFYPEHNATIYFADRFADPPPELALVAGDAAHNLRSSLDLLAWALYRRTNSGDGRHIYFPICESPEKYKTQAPGKIKGIGSTDVTAINSLQPYGTGNDDLWGLHEMDIADKHRLLATPVIAVGQIGLRVTADLVTRRFGDLMRSMYGDVENFRLSGEFFEGIHWFNNPNRLSASKAGDPVAVISGNYESHEDFEFTFDIALGEPEVFKGKPILETLVHLSDLVSGIVDSFELP